MPTSTSTLIRDALDLVRSTGGPGRGLLYSVTSERYCALGALYRAAGAPRGRLGHGLTPEVRKFDPQVDSATTALTAVILRRYPHISTDRWARTTPRSIVSLWNDAYLSPHPASALPDFEAVFTEAAAASTQPQPPLN